MVLSVNAAELPSLRARLETLARPRSLARARFAVHDDGRASWEAPTTAMEIARVIQSACVAACVSVAGSLLWSWMFFVALPVGFSVGLSWAIGTMTLDRRRLRAEARRWLRAATASAAGSP
jgi:hypothetical protein